MSASLLSRYQVVYAAVVFQSFLHSDEKFDPIHYELGQLHFIKTNGLQVADFVDARTACTLNTSNATFSSFRVATK